MTIYTKLLEAGCEMDNHESDLYVKCSPEAFAILKQAGLAANAEAFRSEIDGEMWIELPFRFDPFWARKPTQ